MTILSAKTCRRCSESKPLAEFGNRQASPDGLSVYCRPCTSFLNVESRLVRKGLLMRVPRPALVEKNCARCDQTKPVSEFQKKKSSGVQLYDSWCYTCHSVYAKTRYASQPDAKREARRQSIIEWRKRNPERAAAADARYRKRHPEKVAALQSQWLLDNPERARAIRAKRRATVRQAKILPITGEQISQRMAYFGNKCWMCRGPFENIDHVKPVSKGGAHILANLRPACASCNNRKHAKWFGVAELHRFIRA